MRLPWKHQEVNQRRARPLHTISAVFNGKSSGSIFFLFCEASFGSSFGDSHSDYVVSPTSASESINMYSTLENEAGFLHTVLHPHMLECFVKQSLNSIVVEIFLFP